jgi:UDP-N-acetylglucosamine 2-epimerase
MSDIFFNEMNIPDPDYNLGVGSGSHGEQTGKMLSRVEWVLMQEKPDLVLVYGDTNSTLAGALAATKLNIPVGHIEAGLRSYDRSMPEEQNRIVTDHLSTHLFCPTDMAEFNLSVEGITDHVYVPGDVQIDALEIYLKRPSGIIERLGLKPKKYILSTIHRPVNTDNIEALSSIINALGESDRHIVLPIHPRTRKVLAHEAITACENIQIIDPVGYIDMLHLMKNADKVVTDSGGVQKEAYVMGIPCITIRDTTEWGETLENGWNILVGSDKAKIKDAIKTHEPTGKGKIGQFGDGNACRKIVEIISSL